MKFMDSIIKDSMYLWEAAAHESFLEEMGKGTLDRQKFLDYIVQDSIYLRDYLKAFAMAMYKSDSLKQMQVFYSILGFVNDSENATRLKYLQDNSMTDEDVDKMQKLPACRNYTQFLLDTAKDGDIPEILMAVMPCMLGYYYVFKSVLDKYPGVKDGYFAPLVADYTSEFYKECCEYWTEYCNEVCKDADGEKKKRLSKIFEQASAHELYFWQMAGGKI